MASGGESSRYGTGQLWLRQGRPSLALRTLRYSDACKVMPCGVLFPTRAMAREPKP